jgi:hypothetical protein
MEYKLGLMEPRCIAEINRRHIGAAAGTQEEAFDPVPEEQSDGEEAGYGSAV